MAKLVLSYPETVIIEDRPGSRKVRCTVESVGESGEVHRYEIRGVLKISVSPMGEPVKRP